MNGAFVRRAAKFAIVLGLAVAWQPIAAAADSCKFSAEGDPDPHPMGGWQARCTTSEGYQCSLFDGTPAEHVEIIYVFTDPKDKNLVQSSPNIVSITFASASIPDGGVPSIGIGGVPLARSRYEHTDAAFKEVTFTFDRHTPIFEDSAVTFAAGPWRRTMNFAALRTDGAVRAIVSCAMNYKR